MYTTPGASVAARAEIAFQSADARCRVQVCGRVAVAHCVVGRIARRRYVHLDMTLAQRTLLAAICGGVEGRFSVDAIGRCEAAVLRVLGLVWYHEQHQEAA